MTEFWRFGPWPVPCGWTPELAQRLEAAGWDGFMVGECQGIGPDPYVVLALAATATTTLKVGTAVAVPLRHPQLAASSMATVNALAGGRTVFSIGRGDAAMHLVGQGPVPLREFGVYVDRVQGYLRREPVNLDGFESTMAPFFTIDESLDLPKPTIDIAATGPKAIRVAARVADSMTFAAGGDADRLRTLLDDARAARADAGLDPAGLCAGCFVPVAVTSDDFSLDDARALIRGAVVTQSRFSKNAVSKDADDDFNVAMREGKGHDAGTLYGDERVDTDLIDSFAVVGDPERCAERLRPIVDLGFQRIVLITRPLGVDYGEDNAQRIAETVLPLLRS